MTACSGAGGRTTVSAVLPNGNNLYVGSEVRVLGLRVGDVTKLEPVGPSVLATMRLDPEITLPADVRAIITPESLLGQRYVQLDPPYQGGPRLPAGGTIPRERTAAPAELDDVLSSFDRFLAQLDPKGLADLVDVLAATLAGQGRNLNRLLDNSATSVRVLADSSDDLNAVVRQLADVNAAVATRDEQLGQTLEDLSTVVRTLGEEGDTIVSGVGNLRRLVVNLRPLTDEHGDPLVTDIEALTTTLSTVERNLDRVGDLLLGARRLFEGAGRAFDYETARIRLDDELQAAPEAIMLRLRERLVGVCMRLGRAECATPAFWNPLLPQLLCQPAVARCTDKPTLARAIRAALGHLPPDALGQLAREARQRAQAPQPPPTPATGQTPQVLQGASDLLPVPDRRLHERPQPERVRDRLARLLGGG
ncbi:MAG: MCE family protein [Egibacteraceae bacterium]